MVKSGYMELLWKLITDINRKLYKNKDSKKLINNKLINNTYIKNNIINII